MRWLLLLMLTLLPRPAAAQAGCADGPAAAAGTNAASLTTLAWAPFRRPETGWQVYATRIAFEIGTSCRADTPGFAAALARWQAANHLPPTGILDGPGFAAMNTRWTLARPFARLARGGTCPDAPQPAALATAAPGETYGGKTLRLRADALAAYRRLVAAARTALPDADRDWFRIFSGFRDPVGDDIRCAIDNNCYGVVRAGCSAHRTGLAIDMDVGHAPGFGPDSSDDANRRAMVQTLAYRWLVANAGRFGFDNYVFEPWHWEWRGPTPPAP